MPRRKGSSVALNKDGTIRKPRSDRKNPVLPKLDDDTFFKLKLLANVCDQFHTHLAEEILIMALNHPDIINHFQNKYRVVNRILPVTRDGQLEYCL
ncbi:MAG: hypothetical protein K0Q73_7705 [Paenibacillus sp.]|nr:hypothetical protein [Paenibacillus sp.]